MTTDKDRYCSEHDKVIGLMAERRATDKRQVALEQRCAIKEKEHKETMVIVAKLEERVDSLEECREDSYIKIAELQAWKNKALGYLGMFGVMTGLIIEAFRERFFGGGP